MAQRLVIVGGNAAGMSAAAQARRRNVDLEIVALERGPDTSWSSCGIPALVGGSVESAEQLVVRRPDDFRAARIDARIGHEVTGIDLDARRLEVCNRGRDRTFSLGFDLLLLATGARPVRPGVPGVDGPTVHGVQTLDDARRLLADAERQRPRHVVVVGSGYVGLELAEAFRDRGAAVTVAERGPEVMATLDPDMGALVAQAMRSAGITVRVGEALVGIDSSSVTTSAGSLPADLVVLGTGAAPDTTLAEAAGLRLGRRGAVTTDRRQRTSAEGVWAAGDCCETRHVVTGDPWYEPLGTVANRQGRVAGVNLAGGYATFPGVAGTAITRVCRTEVARTGLDTAQALAAGLEVISATVRSTTVAGYLPDPPPITAKLLAEAGTGRVLGAQLVGGPGTARRIDVVATALAGRLAVDDLVGLDLGYAPPFGSVWEPVQIAARELLGRLGRA